MAARSRLPLYLGLGVAGAGGYYLYSAGGSPRVASKEFQREAYLTGSELLKAKWSLQMMLPKYSQVLTRRLKNRVKNGQPKLV